MKSASQLIPRYDINEYQIVISPHEELRNKILKIKQEFSEKYGTTSLMKMRPHIVLATFKQYEMMEERLLSRLNVIAMGFQPVKIELKDYGSFPTHTIFINVTSKVPIQDLVRQIRTDAQKLMKLNDDNKPHFIMEPYITIARKLQATQFEKSWIEYSHRHFTGRFIADGMLLLKRREGEMKYQVVKRFEFQNLLINTTQGTLFS